MDYVNNDGNIIIGYREFYQLLIPDGSQFREVSPLIVVCTAHVIIAIVTLAFS
jgi:hypothetical protein